MSEHEPICPPRPRLVTIGVDHLGGGYMPSLANVITESDLYGHRESANAFMESSFAIIDEIVESGGVGGMVALEAGDHVRTVKRRLSVAAKARGHKLAWRKTAQANTLRFTLDGADARKRRIRIVPERELVAV